MSRRLNAAIVLVTAASGIAYADEATTPAPSTPPTQSTPSTATTSTNAPSAPSATTSTTSTTPTTSATAPPTSTSTPEASTATAPAEASASGSSEVHSAVAPPDLGDQGMGASVGVVTGGRDTPGGLRISGHYLYQLSDQDWFDGVAAFTFGGGGAACFRDRMDVFLCDHGLADGNAVELAANVRRFLGGKGDFWPFVRAGVGVEIVRFGSDDVTGIAVPLHLGGGIRVSVSPSVAVIAHAELEVGLARFNHTLGLEPQLGASIAAGAEFKL